MTPELKATAEEMYARYWEMPWHDEVFRLCQQHGFGAVMQSASEQWRKLDPVGALSLGPCFGTLAS